MAARRNALLAALAWQPALPQREPIATAHRTSLRATAGDGGSLAILTGNFSVVGDSATFTVSAPAGSTLDFVVELGDALVAGGRVDVRARQLEHRAAADEAVESHADLQRDVVVIAVACGGEAQSARADCEDELVIHFAGLRNWYRIGTHYIVSSL